MTHDHDRDCMHGLLLGNCYVCSLEAENEEQAKIIAELQAKIERIDAERNLFTEAA